MNKIRGKEKNLRFFNPSLFPKSRKGDVLIGEVIFLVLNLVFLSILIIFVISKTNDASLLEEKYAKQIALVIDSAKPGMTIHINMEDAIKKAQDEKQDIKGIVKINDNIVTLKLKEKGGYPYSFFNDISANAYLDTGNNKEYVIVITEK
jgi:hypothetical protein